MKEKMSTLRNVSKKEYKKRHFLRGKVKKGGVR